MEFAQTAERGLAGAEIVERHTDADATQVLDDLLGRGWIVHQAGFGDLDLQPARVEAGAVEDRQYVQPGVLVDELRRRQVEGQEQILGPAPGRLGGLAQHKLRQRADDAPLLGDRDEDRRRDRAEITICPARQRLEADDATGPKIDDGLEMRLDLAGRDGPAQRLLDAGDALGRFFHLSAIDDHPSAARTLGMVQRRLGLADQNLGGLVARIEHRAADRSRKPGSAFADIVGRRQDLDQRSRLFGRRLLAEHHRIEEGIFV